MSPARTLALAAVLAAAAAAQAPSPWADLSIPGGVYGANVSALGKLVVYTEPGQVHVFSAFTRRWHARAVSGNVSVRQANDWVMFQDGAAMVGFSAMRGQFETLPVSASAAVLNPTAQRNDSLLLLRDGGALHVFSGLAGGWHSRAFGANATVAVQRHVALVADGNLLSAFDAYDTAWHDLTLASPATALSADGAAGTAESPGMVHGFAATTGTWASAPALTGSVQFLRNDDWAAWYDGSQALAFSGLRGTFAATALGVPSETSSQDDLVALRDGTSVSLFSAITGTWAVTPFAVSGNMRADVAVALLADGLDLQAFSAVTGQLALLQLDSSGEALGANILAAVDRLSGQPWLFSALTGSWAAAPNDVLPGQPMLATQSALLPTATGYRAFSSRSGAFVPLASAGGAAVVNAQSSVLMAWDPAFVHVFEPRRDVWISRARSGTGAPTAQIWRTSALAVDGAEALGFGAQAGALAATALAEPMLSFGANSECAYVITPTHVYAFGAVPVPCSQYQFPEFRRAFTAGATLRLQLRLPRGDVALLGIGPLAATPAPLPGIGELLLSNLPLALLLVQPDAGEDKKALAWPVPGLPGLRGTEWGFQALVLPSLGMPYLSDVGDIVVL